MASKTKPGPPCPKCSGVIFYSRKNTCVTCTINRIKRYEKPVKLDNLKNHMKGVDYS